MAPLKAKIILGSASKARQAILKEMGYEFDIVTADIDEKAVRRESPEDLVMALAEAKAQAILPKLASTKTGLGSQPVLLITADQVVIHEGLILEKPLNAAEARLFIQGYARSPGSTVGAVMVTNLSTGLTASGIARTEVYFHPIPDHVIDSLIEEGAVYRAAGALPVEHPLVLPLVEAMVGSRDSAMGLPMKLTSSLIARALDI